MSESVHYVHRPIDQFSVQEVVVVVDQLVVRGLQEAGTVETLKFVVRGLKEAETVEAL